MLSGNDALRDLYYVVSKNEINQQADGYNDILPTEVYRKTDGKIRNFIMRFTKQDGTET